jgi:hypothetical protein
VLYPPQDIDKPGDYKISQANGFFASVGSFYDFQQTTNAFLVGVHKIDS